VVIGHAANEVEPGRRYLQLLTTYRVQGAIVNAPVVRNSKREIAEGIDVSSGTGLRLNSDICDHSGCGVRPRSPSRAARLKEPHDRSPHHAA
jgi:hypothetical protein